MTDFTDRREEVLKRIAAVIRNVPGVIRFARNAQSSVEGNLPLVVLNDGNEEAAERTQQRSPLMVTLAPEIVIVANGDEQSAPETIHKIRRGIIKAIYSDDNIISIVGPNGYVAYSGMDIQYETGRRVEVEAIIRMTVVYPLIIKEL